MGHGVRVIGYLGKDPEVRYTQGGKAVASFSVACTKKIGENKKTIWFRISAWEKKADLCKQYLHKGSHVYIEGELQFDDATGGPRLFQRQDGSQGTSFEVTANVIEFLDSKSDREKQNQAPAEDEGEDDEGW